MLKKIKAGIIGATLTIGLTGCQSELENEDLKGLKSCFTKPNGVVLWSNDILTTSNILKNTGIKVTVLKDGSELIIDMGNKDSIILEEINFNNDTCYEVQKITGDKGELVKDSGDNFLLVTAQFFGRLGLTKQEQEEKIIRDNKKKQERLVKDNAEILKAETKYKKALDKYNDYQKVLTLKNEFEKRTNINTLKYKLKLTDEMLNEILEWSKILMKSDNEISMRIKNDIQDVVNGKIEQNYFYNSIYIPLDFNIKKNLRYAKFEIESAKSSVEATKSIINGRQKDYE